MCTGGKSTPSLPIIKAMDHIPKNSARPPKTYLFHFDKHIFYLIQERSGHSGIKSNRKAILFEKVRYYTRGKCFNRATQSDRSLITDEIVCLFG